MDALTAIARRLKMGTVEFCELQRTLKFTGDMTRANRLDVCARQNLNFTVK